eukprot:CAMPEP_0196600332 /NCGR_PEP_ID=MMETSP1081-20130531/95333_1 /TAXON_ID=36882 /ORGANISM="Pyramimonas amylifera, Strain CCMP720" /LENGTH=158 /DNA_ID=CAMNT_0041926163 /DNA_START=455 /DNA_END=931 /DNA_ORIENTATION=-
MPLGGTLSRVGEETEGMFRLTVPAVQIFDLRVEPVLVCKVTQETYPHPCVQIESTDCKLDGSPFVQSLHKYYDFHVKTQFTWEEGQVPAISSFSDIKVLLDPPPPFSFFPKEVLEATGNFVMDASCKALQRTFVQNLANDYRKWCVDAEYRRRRATPK